MIKLCFCSGDTAMQYGYSTDEPIIYVGVDVTSSIQNVLIWNKITNKWALVSIYNLKPFFS